MEVVMVNAAHLHIALVHIPVVLIPTATILLALGVRRRSVSLSQVAFSLCCVAAVVGIGAFLLGEGAEELVEHLPGISEDTIEEHEEIAEFAVWSLGIAGFLSLLGLFGIFRNGVPQRAISLMTLLVAVISSGALVYTAYEGGKIRHPEAYEAVSETSHDERDEESSLEPVVCKAGEGEADCHES
jgi:uncharacterized membrane protein